MSVKSRRVAAGAALGALVVLGFLVATCVSATRRSADDATESPAAAHRADVDPLRHGTSPATTASGASDSRDDRVRNHGALRGRATRVDGTTPVEVRVHAEPIARIPGASDPRKPSSTTADGTGAFDFVDLAAGDWQLLCDGDGALRVPVGIVRVPDVPRFDFALPVGSIYRGKLVDDVTGEPIVGAGLRNGIAETTTAADGSFVIDTHRPDEGRSAFEIVAPGYRPKPVGPHFESDVIAVSPPGGTYALELRACRGATVRGVVTGPGGPVAGAQVALAWTWPERVCRATTDDAGRYAFEHVDGGLAVVKVSAPGLVPPDANSFWVEAGIAEGSDAADIDVPDEGELVHNVALVSPSFRRVRGRVLDDADAPVEGAKVASVFHERRVETTSAADGAFELADVITCSGASVLVVSHDGFEAATETIDPPAVDPVEGLEIKLSRLPQVVGHVSDAAGAAVPGTRVFVVSYQWKEDLLSVDGRRRATSEARVSADGGYAATFPPDFGWLAVTATAPGRPAATEVRELPRKAPVPVETIDVVLRDGTTLAGRVVRAGTDAPAEGVLVSDVATLHRLAGPNEGVEVVQEDIERVVARTDVDGAFVVSDVAQGPRRLRVSGPGWIARTVDLDVSSAAVRIEIDHERSIAGRLEFDDGTPARGVVVVAYGGPKTAPATCPDGRAWPVTTDAAGRFEVRGLPPGSYSLDIANERPGACWVPVTGGATEIAEAIVGPIVAGTGEERSIGVARGLSISGRVVDPDGRPAGDLIVYGTPENNKSARGGAAWVGDDGTFLIGGLSAGAYALRVSENDFAPAEVGGVRAGGAPIVVKLDRGLAIEGVLLDADGQPRAGGGVTAEPLAGGPDDVKRWTSSDESGHVVITGLTRGRWRIKGQYPVALPSDLVLDAGSKDVILRCVDPLKEGR